MKLSYRHTVAASFIGYVVQAIVNIFVPLLFVTFQSQYGIPLSEITVLIAVNFAVQLAVDISSAFFIDKIGYRAAAIMAHGFAAAGLILLTFLPDLFANGFWGLLISVVVYAFGGGLLEVIVSPVVEACPTKNKAQTMGFLHSFYCWGSFAVVGFSTLFFSLCGTENWKIMTYIWAVVPLCNLVYFIFVPLAPLSQEAGGAGLKTIFKNKYLWLFLLIMLCAGASELAISQWASLFAEKGLGVSKTVGDLAGPAVFALLMGTSRIIYGKLSKKIGISYLMLFGGVLCIAAYLIVALVPNPVAGLVGVGLSGFAVGALWPGAFSLAVDSVKGGTALFSFLALAGDSGCILGPAVAGAFGENLHTGILVAAVFPAVLIAALVLFIALKGSGKKRELRKGNGTDQLS